MMGVTNNKRLKLTVELTEKQASLLIGLVRRQVNEALRGWSFTAWHGLVAPATERQVANWTEIMAILLASAEEAQEVE